MEKKEEEKKKTQMATEQDVQHLIITGGMTIKTITRNQIPPVRMDIIKKFTNKCWRGCGEKGTLLHC